MSYSGMGQLPPVPGGYSRPLPPVSGGYQKPLTQRSASPVAAQAATLAAQAAQGRTVGDACALVLELRRLLPAFAAQTFRMPADSAAQTITGTGLLQMLWCRSDFAAICSADPSVPLTSHSDLPKTWFFLKTIQAQLPVMPAPVAPSVEVVQSQVMRSQSPDGYVTETAAPAAPMMVPPYEPMMVPPSRSASTRAPIRVGQLATTDPIMSASSLIASRLLVQMAKRPGRSSVAWVQGEMNKSEPRLGNDFASRRRQLVASGVAPDQATFDALRLAFANMYATKFQNINRANRGASGLGESVGDINAGFCGVMGTVGVGGSVATSLLDNPTGSVAIGQATTGIMGANSCNAEAIRAQAALVDANGRAAALLAGASAGAPADNTVLYVGLGVGALMIFGLGAVVLLKKK